MRQSKGFFVSFVIVLVLGGLIFSLPPIRSRVFNLMEDARVRVRSIIFPQNEVAFVPGGEVMPTVTPAVETPLPSPTRQPSPTLALSTPLPSATPAPSATAQPSPTALPASVALHGVRWETQNGAWNYCGPTNLSMLLSYWGWKGDKFATGKVLKPFEYDLNVMPYEMQNYVDEKTDLKLKVRYGGTLAMVKKLIAAGYPVLTEVGVYFTETTSGQTTWMGHYRTLTGYNDAKKELIVQDSFIKADLAVSYDAFITDWRAFDFVFLVAYSKDKEAQLSAILGDYNDVAQNYQMGLKISSDEMWKLSGIDQYFAWFNRGTSLVQLQDYIGAAEAYDKAFELYAKLPEDRRPFRMLWHQTGPYYAYFYSGRYQDTANLATLTIDFIKQRAERLGIADKPMVGPFLEETWVWRGRARLVIGNQKGAVEDFRMALKYHPGFPAAVDELKKLGLS
jgi:tetratricopeptide (TPR) repeat protein